MKQNKAREEIVKLFMDCLHKEDIPWHQGFVPSRTSFSNTGICENAMINSYY